MTKAKTKAKKKAETRAKLNINNEPRLSYLPALDGLRALAVIAVLLYHADLSWAAGGYLGVEVFFVLSGYLITSLLLTEWVHKGTLNLPGFWLRRARRLLPALFLLLAATLTFAVLFLPDEAAKLRTDGLAAFGYITNWYLIFHQQSYFETVGRPSLLQHLWSLAVEEQFYLCWPLLFILGVQKLKLRLSMPALLIAGAAISSLLMAFLYQPDADPSRVYYGTDTRAAGLLLGCGMAFLWTPHIAAQGRKATRLAQSRALDIAGVGFLAVLVWLCTHLDENQPFLYRGGFTVTDLATLGLIAVLVHPAARLLPFTLGWEPLRWIGLRSYGIYLWHWPVFDLTRPQLDLPLDGMPLLGVRLALTLVLAELSYRLVETPIRKGALGRGWNALRSAHGPKGRRLRARWATTGLFAAALVVVLVAALAAAKPSTVPDYLSMPDVTSANTGAALPASPTHQLGAENPSALVTGNSGTAVPASATPKAPTVIPTLTQPPTTATPLPPAPSDTPLPAPTSTVTATPSETAIVAKPIGSTPKQATATTIRHTAPSPTVEAVPTAIAIQPQPTDQASIASVEQPGDPSAAPETSSTPPATESMGMSTATETATQNAPTPPPISPPMGTITAVGDSVMLGAVTEMRRVIGDIDIDAVKGRQASAALALLQAKSKAGTLGSVVIIHIGNNGYFSNAQFAQMMQILSNVPRVIFVDNKVPRQWETTNNNVITSGVSHYPNAVLVDWRSVSINHPEYFYSDGIHLRPAGARAYTQLIAASLGN